MRCAVPPYDLREPRPHRYATDLPPSTLMMPPVVAGRCSTQAITATATSSASATHYSGVLAACHCTILVVRPGTKLVSTAAGDTVITRTRGASTRASERLMVSSAAFDPP